MIRKLIFLAVLLCAGSAFGSINLVNGCSAQSGNVTPVSTVSCTVTGMTSGHLIVVVGVVCGGGNLFACNCSPGTGTGQCNGSGTVCTNSYPALPSDSLASTFNHVFTVDYTTPCHFADGTMSLYWFISTSSTNDTFTINPAAAGDMLGSTIQVYEFDQPYTPSGFDVSATATGNTANATAGTITTVFNSDLILGLADGATGGFAATAGYAIISTCGGSACVTGSALAAQFKTAGAAGGYSAPWTNPSCTGCIWGAAAVGFRSSLGTSGLVKHRVIQ